MLGKLVKYEFKASARVLPIVYLVIAASYLVALLAKAIHITPAVFMMSMTMVIGTVAAVVMTLLIVILRYFNGLFGAEGYLTQTLPVEPGHLIASKAVNAFLWIIISGIIAILTCAAVLQIWDYEQIRHLVNYVLDTRYSPALVYFLFYAILQLFIFLGLLYFAIALANTRSFIKNNIAFSILFYFIGYFILNILDLAAILFIPYGIQWTGSDMIWANQSMFAMLIYNSAEMDIHPFIGIGNLVVNFLAGTGLLILTRWLLKHKVSVK